MLLKTFTAKNGKKIILRKLERNDIGRAKEFMELINEIIDEDDYVHYDRKFSLKEERTWIKNGIKTNLEGTSVTVFAEFNGTLVGSSDITSKNGRESHIATFGIVIKKAYRSIGIGTQLIMAITEEAKKSLKIKPKIIELDVFETNKNAQAIYQKLGFKEIARLPNRIQLRGQTISKIIMERYV